MSKAKFILSKSKVMEQYNKLVPLADIISYSSKTNPMVTKVLEGETDCLFSIHFKNELKHIDDCSRVIFLAQGWDLLEIKELVDLGIKNFAVDNISDLNSLLSFLEESKTIINLYLRLKLKENTIRTEKYFVFGMSSEVINQKVRELKSNPKIGQLGIHFHRKTQNMSEWNLEYELSQMIEDDVWGRVDLVNIGGGLPAEYANTNVKVFEGIFKRIAELREWLKEKGVRLMIEPGRFIAAPAGRLVTKILGVDKGNIIVNASVYNTNMDALIVPVKLLVEGEVSRGEGEAYVIKGITPCSMDLFRYRVYLSRVPKVGEDLVFLNAGAYNFGTDFCDLDKLETEMGE